jgi:manganese-dependent inorganic pyrophosphatase
MNKKRIFIIGHKNPDTDSVCSAIGLSYLKNKLGYNTIPCILGGINSETKYALDYFKFKLPLHLNDVKLQIRDVNYHKNNYIDKNSTLKYALDYMNKYSLTGIPVVEEKNKYFGLITLKEIAGEVINGNFHKIDTSYGNIIDILNGNKVLKYDKEIKGTLITNNNTNNKTNNLILISNNNDIVINSKVKLIIFVSNQNISNSLLNKLRKNKINAIRTSYDYYEVSKLLTLSNYVKNFVINMVSCFMGAYQLYHVRLGDTKLIIHEYNPKNKRIFQQGETAYLSFESENAHCI